MNTHGSRGFELPESHEVSMSITDLCDLASNEDRARVLRDLQRIGHQIEEWRGWVVDDMRKAGASWQDVADGLGVSKQAAQQKYGA